MSKILAGVGVAMVLAACEGNDVPPEPECTAPVDACHGDPDCWYIDCGTETRECPGFPDWAAWVPDCVGADRAVTRPGCVALTPQCLTAGADTGQIPACVAHACP